MKKLFAILGLFCAVHCHGFNFPYRTNVVYVAVTAYDAAGLESDYSAELVITNWMGGTKRFDQFVDIAWNLETDPTVIGYNVYVGNASRTYQWVYNAGDTNWFKLPLFHSVPRNQITTFSAPVGGLLRADSLEGPWTPVSNPYSVTNYVGTFFIGGTDKTTINKEITWN